MKRRNFLGMGLAMLASIPAALSAVDFRKDKPKVWEEKNVYDGKKPTEKGVEAAIKDLYGDIKPEAKGVTVKTPDTASNGGAVPVSVKSDIDAKTVAVFQDANPEAAVGVWSVADGQSVDYEFKIKMKASGTITAVVEGKDGKFYVGKKSLNVALGGCEG